MLATLPVDTFEPDPLRLPIPTVLAEGVEGVVLFFPPFPLVVEVPLPDALLPAAEVELVAALPLPLPFFPLFVPSSEVVELLATVAVPSEPFPFFPPLLPVVAVVLPLVLLLDVDPLVLVPVLAVDAEAPELVTLKKFHATTLCDSPACCSVVAMLKLTRLFAAVCKAVSPDDVRALVLRRICVYR